MGGIIPGHAGGRIPALENDPSRQAVEANYIPGIQGGVNMIVD